MVEISEARVLLYHTIYLPFVNIFDLDLWAGRGHLIGPLSELDLIICMVYWLAKTELQKVKESRNAEQWNIFFYQNLTFAFHMPIVQGAQIASKHELICGALWLKSCRRTDTKGRTLNSWQLHFQNFAVKTFCCKKATMWIQSTNQESTIPQLKLKLFSYHSFEALK